MKYLLFTLIIISASLSCGQNSDKQKHPAKSSTADHTVFENFWKDFKTAVLAKDKMTVLALTSMPYIHRNSGEIVETFSSYNSDQFLANYDNLFNEGILSAISNDEYIINTKYNKEMPNEIPSAGNNNISGDAYTLDSKTTVKDQGQERLVFLKIDGKYKLRRGTFLN